MMTSKVLQTLARKGLVERLADPGDGRAKQLQLTILGETQLRQANTLVEQVDNTFFRPLATDATPFNGLMQRLATATPASEGS
jgi:DNA-binding MarR family transcriptional regulator